jgi:hypothetical protein
MNESSITTSRQSPFKRGYHAVPGAFHRECSGYPASKPLGNHANFVINFCQILFWVKNA